MCATPLLSFEFIYAYKVGLGLLDFAANICLIVIKHCSYHLLGRPGPVDEIYTDKVLDQSLSSFGVETLYLSMHFGHAEKILLK